ncbi:hypothetical protein OA007_02145 [SAR116 cluster bacterium]|nr:hypothetical protein [SAR116 cluster bacterium]
MANFNQLKEAGVLYLNSTRENWHNSWKFAAFFQEDKTEFLRVSKAAPKSDPFEGFLIGIRRELNEAVEQGINTFLISSEHLYSRLKSEPEIAALADYLHQNFEEVRIIFWAREQIKLLESAYSTALRVGERATIEDFFKDNFRLESPYLNFDLGLRFWETYFGREAITVKVYEQEIVRATGIEAGFLSDLGVDTSCFDAIERKNESLPGTAAKALWIVNNEFNLTEEERDNFIDAILEHRLPDSDFGKISELYLETNLFNASNKSFFEKFNNNQWAFPTHKCLKLGVVEEADFEPLFFQFLLKVLLKNKTRTSSDFYLPISKPFKI